MYAYNIQLVTDISFLSNNWESCSNRPTWLAWSNYSLLLPWKFFKATWWVSPQLKVFMLQIYTSDTNAPKEQNQKLSAPQKPEWCFVRSPSAADTSQLPRNERTLWALPSRWHPSCAVSGLLTSTAAMRWGAAFLPDIPPRRLFTASSY